MKPRRILVFLPNWIGDVLFTTPAVHVIRVNHPRAHLAVLVWPSCAEVLEANPDIDEIIFNHEEDQHRGLLGRWRLISQLRRKKFDVIYLFHRSRTRALMCVLAGIPERIGYATKNRKAFLTTPLPPQDYDTIHRVEYYLGIVRGAGLKIQEPVHYIYEVRSEDQRWAREFLAKKGIGQGDLKIVLSPGGNRASRRWSASHYGKLAKKMIETWGAKIILTGVGHQKEIFEEMIREASYSLISAVGETNLKQLAALLKEADLYIGNDSGPTHLAQAIRTPLLAFYSPQHPKITGPYGIGHKVVLYKNKGCEAPCYSPDCESRRCIDEISVEEAFQAAQQLLDQKVAALK